MIKILKEGKIPKPTKLIYKITCPNCKCKFEFENEDCIIGKGIFGTMTVKCPCCHTEMTQRHFDNRIVEVEE